MRKTIFSVTAILLMLFALSGCSSIGNKNASISTIYGSAAAISLLLLVCYCFMASKHKTWFILLLSSVTVVNIGYFALAVSKTLNGALFANRVSYLGSVFLPLAMLMIILKKL